MGRQTVSRQAPGRRARPIARQAVRQLPQRGWPGRLTALEAGQSQSYLGRQHPKICRTKHEFQPSPRQKTNLACLPVSYMYSSQLAGRPALHPAVCQEAGKQTWTNFWPKCLVRHQPSDRLASRQGSWQEPDSQLSISLLF